MASALDSPRDWLAATLRKKLPTAFWNATSKAATTRWCWSCAILEPNMNRRANRMSRDYAATLRRYLVRQQEGRLQEAYELGRKAIASGLGVLDMARIHQQALSSCLSRARSTETKAR